MRFLRARFFLTAMIIIEEITKNISVQATFNYFVQLLLLYFYFWTWNKMQWDKHTAVKHFYFEIEQQILLLMVPFLFSIAVFLFYSDLFKKQEMWGSKFLVNFALRQKKPFTPKKNLSTKSTKNVPVHLKHSEFSMLFDTKRVGNANVPLQCLSTKSCKNWEMKHSSSYAFWNNAFTEDLNW